MPLWGMSALAMLHFSANLHWQAWLYILLTVSLPSLHSCLTCSWAGGIGPCIRWHGMDSQAAVLWLHGPGI